MLQPLALSNAHEDRAAGVGLRRVDELRRAVAALGSLPSTPAERPLWVVGRNLAPLVLGAVALVVLLAQIGNFRVALDAARQREPRVAGGARC